jgi:hypothetical protein
VLTATGQTSGLVTTNFTDGLLSTVVLNTQSGTATQGTGASVTYTVTLTKNRRFENYNLIVSGLPAGASGTFATSPLALASSNPSTKIINYKHYQFISCWYL